VCRAPAAACDLGEVCTGGSTACPIDVGDPGCSGPGPGIAFVRHVGSGGEITPGNFTAVTVPAGQYSFRVPRAIGPRFRR